MSWFHGKPSFSWGLELLGNSLSWPLSNMCYLSYDYFGKHEQDSGSLQRFLHVFVRWMDWKSSNWERRIKDIPVQFVKQKNGENSKRYLPKFSTFSAWRNKQIKRVCLSAKKRWERFELVCWLRVSRSIEAALFSQKISRKDHLTVFHYRKADVSNRF